MANNTEYGLASIWSDDFNEIHEFINKVGQVLFILIATERMTIVFLLVELKTQDMDVINLFMHLTKYLI